MAPFLCHNSSSISHMPVRRSKACDGCRTAKARCSLSVPCSRCLKRHIDCQYTPKQPRNYDRRKVNDFRLIKPASKVSIATDVGDRIGPVLYQGGSSYIEAATDSARVPAMITSLVSTERQSGYADWLCDLDFLDVATDYPHVEKYSSIPTHSFGLELLAPVWVPDVAVLSPPGLSCVSHSIGSAFCTPSSQTNLSQRTRSLQQGSLTAKMVFSRLTEYTRMLADGKQLPPFLFPPCVLGCGDECDPDSRHSCLPAILAVCANLTQMFHLRTPSSHDFVWHQICTHLRQLRAEVSLSTSM